MQPNARLRHEREQRGWSQARVAEQIDSDAVNVSRWERGFSSPSPYYREKLCLLFGKNAQELGLLSENEAQKFSAQGSSISLPFEEQQQATEVRSSLPSRDSRILSSLSYTLWWVSGIPIFLFNRDNPFVRFHSLQSLLFFGGITVFDIITIALLSFFSPELLQFILVLVFSVLNIIAITAWIVGMVKAGMGIYYRLPLVGSMSEKIAVAMMKQ